VQKTAGVRFEYETSGLSTTVEDHAVPEDDVTELISALQERQNVQDASATETAVKSRGKQKVTNAPLLESPTDGAKSEHTDTVQPKAAKKGLKTNPKHRTDKETELSETLKPSGIRPPTAKAALIENASAAEPEERKTKSGATATRTSIEQTPLPPDLPMPKASPTDQPTPDKEDDGALAKKKPRRPTRRAD